MKRSTKLALAALTLVWLGALAAPAEASLESDLAYAAGNGDYTLVKQLAESGANLNARDEEGYTALIWAAQHGQTRVATYLIEHGANLNPLDKGGYTPLMWAAQEGHFEMVQLLLERGANANARNWNGRSALEVSRWGANPRVRDLVARYASGALRPQTASRSNMAQRPLAANPQTATPQLAQPSAAPAMMGMTANNPMAARPLVEPDPVTKVLALKKLAESALHAGQDVQAYIKTTTSSFNPSALLDPDIPLGKELTMMYANVARNQSLVGCRQDWQKVKAAWNNRQDSRFAKYVLEADQILSAAGL